MENALRQLLSNAWEAIDQMYFATPSKTRQRESFQHRTCVRIACSSDPSNGGGYISITDMGTGMTRADLINALGIGRLSHRAHAASKRLIDPKDLPSVEEGGGDDDDTGSLEDTEDSDDYDETTDDDEEDPADDENGAEPIKIEEENDAPKDIILPCCGQDIGGFYSALCSLGVGVNVGAKVRSNF